MKIIGKSLSEGVTGARVGERIETRRERRLKGGVQQLNLGPPTRGKTKGERLVTHSAVVCVCVCSCRRRPPAAIDLCEWKSKIMKSKIIPGWSPRLSIPELESFRVIEGSRIPILKHSCCTQSRDQGGYDRQVYYFFTLFHFLKTLCYANNSRLLSLSL